MRVTIFILLSLSSSVLFGQQGTLRSFDQVSLDFGRTSDLSKTSLGYGQELLIRGKVQVGLGVDIRMNYNRLRMSELPAFSSSQNALRLNKALNNYYLSLPIKGSVGAKGFSIGGALDLLSLTFAQVAPLEAISTDIENQVLTPNGFSWLLHGEDKKRNLSNQLYISYNFDNVVSIQVGLASQFVNYRLREQNEDETLGGVNAVFGDTFRYPFIRLVIFDEK